MKKMDGQISFSCDKTANSEEAMPRRGKLPAGYENMTPEERAKLSPADFILPESEKAGFIERMRESYERRGIEPTPERLEEDWEFVRDF